MDRDNMIFFLIFCFLKTLKTEEKTWWCFRSSINNNNDNNNNNRSLSFFTNLSLRGPNKSRPDLIAFGATVEDFRDAITNFFLILFCLDSVCVCVCVGGRGDFFCFGLIMTETEFFCVGTKYTL